MNDRSLALRRFGMITLVTATVAAGAPLLVGGAAQAGPVEDAIGVLAASSTASASATPSAMRSATPSATPTATISASPSATATATMSPTATSTATISPSGTPTATRSPGGNQPATPPGCARAAEVMLRQTTINATGRAGVSATSTPNSVVDLFAYTRPSTTFRLVRTGTTDSAGNVTFADLRPPANTRLRAQQRGCAFGRDKVLNVRTQLSLNVVRNGTRDYTFSGRATPARSGGLIVSLYRVTADGRQILTAQTRANASDGRYTINRRFTGSGRFGFVVRTGQDLQNAPGSSNVRSLLVF